MVDPDGITAVETEVPPSGHRHICGILKPMVKAIAVSGRRLLKGWVLLLLFLCPLKMGNPIGGGEVANFPIGAWQWLFMSWPPFLLAGASALALLLALWLYPLKRISPLAGLAACSWILLALTALFGLIRTTEWDYALLFWGHLCGVASLVFCVMLIAAREPGFMRHAAGVIAVAVILCWVSGWHQRFVGLEQTKQFAIERAQREGVELQGPIVGKLDQNRVFGSFVNPNSYAAHLILTGPLALLLLWRTARRFEPVHVSQPLFLGVGTILFAGALWFSGSRGAMAALGGGVALGVLALPGASRWRLPIAIAAVLGAGALVGFLSIQRSLLSVSARGDYYLAAWRMFLEHPLSGVGLGEFFPYYMRLKPVGAEETRIVHNMFLCMLSQAGLIAGLSAAVCLALPAAAVFVPVSWRRDDGIAFAAVVAGLGAWSLHSLVDFNVQIPGTVATAAIMSLLLAGEASSSISLPKWGSRALVLILFVFICGAATGWLRIPGEYWFQRAADGVGRVASNRTRRDFERAAEWLPLSPYPSWFYAKVCLAEGYSERAMALVRKAVQRSPHRATFWHRLASMHMLEGDYAGAAADLDRALAWYPGSSSIWTSRALLACLQSTSSAELSSIRKTLLIDIVYRLLPHIVSGKEEMVITLDDRYHVCPPELPLERICELFNGLGMTWNDSSLPIRFMPVPGPGAGADGGSSSH